MACHRKFPFFSLAFLPRYLGVSVRFHVSHVAPPQPRIADRNRAGQCSLVRWVRLTSTRPRPRFLEVQ